MQNNFADFVYRQNRALTSHRSECNPKGDRPVPSWQSFIYRFSVSAGLSSFNMHQAARGEMG